MLEHLGYALPFRDPWSLVVLLLAKSCHDPKGSSRRRRLGVIPHRLVQIPQLECLDASLGDLANDPRRLTSDDAEAGNDHIRRHNRAVENFDVILDDGKLANDDLTANVDVVADLSSLDNGAGADKDVVAETEGHEGEDSV